MTAKEKLVRIVEGAKGDDLERAIYSFRNFSGVEMEAQHGVSGKSRYEILIIHKKVANHMSVDNLKSLLVKCGNRKIPSSTAIFNMGSASECESKRLGLCNAVRCGVKCYALKAEQCYPGVLPFRVRQAEYWKGIRAIDFIQEFKGINNRKRKKLKALRFNESGDFGNQDELDKAEAIARGLLKEGVIVYCYSSRSDLDYSGVRSLVVMGSGWYHADISGEAIIIGKKDLVPEGFVECAGSCKVCDLCMKDGSFIALRKH